MAIEDIVATITGAAGNTQDNAAGTTTGSTGGLGGILDLLKNPDFIQSILQAGSQIGGNVAGTQQFNAAINAAIQLAQQQDQLQRDTLSAERGDRQDQTQLAIDLINQTRAEEAPFQEAALQRTKFGERFLPRIEANLSGVDIPGAPQPGESELFKRALQKSNDRLQRRFSFRGSPSSGPAQVAVGENTASLTAFDIDRQQGIKDNFTNNLFRAAGIGGEPVRSQAPGLAGAATQSLPSAAVQGTNVGGLLQAQGAAQGGLFANIGQTLANFPNIFGNNQTISGNFGQFFPT